MSEKHEVPQLVGRKMPNTDLRKIIVTIGIDAYTHHGRLHNAVEDARGIEALFTEKLGFTAPFPALHNEEATKPNISRLIDEELPEYVKEDDAVVIFFAGHGRSRSGPTRGYLVPIEARKDRWSQYIRVDSFLDILGDLPARHVVVILDACHSGLALGSAFQKMRDGDLPEYTEALLGKKSRFVLTSAGQGEKAADSGAIKGHSLFTGCLLHGLQSGLVDREGRGFVTMSELGGYVQEQVGADSQGMQVPDFGRFAKYVDQRGEMVLRVSAVQKTPSQIEVVSGSGLPHVLALKQMLTDPDLGEMARRELHALADGGDLLMAKFASEALRAVPEKDLHEGKWGGLEWVEVPAGPFWMGSEDGRANEKPHPQVHLDTLWLGKTPVTNSQYKAFVDAAGMRIPGHWQKNDGNVVAHKLDHPVVYVSWDDAWAYCRWLSEMSGEEIVLPSEAQWEKGARGTDGRVYPWGNRWDQAKCNTRESGIGDTTPVGRSVLGRSPYGAMDMAGNVWEWTNSERKSYPYDRMDGREDVGTSGFRVLRGGSWGNDQDYARAAYRNFSDPNSCGSGIGFRVCRVVVSRPPPLFLGRWPLGR